MCCWSEHKKKNFLNPVLVKWKTLRYGFLSILPPAPSLPPLLQGKSSLPVQCVSFYNTDCVWHAKLHMKIHNLLCVGLIWMRVFVHVILNLLLSHFTVCLDELSPLPHLDLPHSFQWLIRIPWFKCNNKNYPCAFNVPPLYLKGRKLPPMRYMLHSFASSESLFVDSPGIFSAYSGK